MQHANTRGHDDAHKYGVPHDHSDDGNSYRLTIGNAIGNTHVHTHTNGDGHNHPHDDQHFYDHSHGYRTVTPHP